MALARDCKHPDAEWLTSIFEGKEVSTKEGARNVFLSHQDDARALCFAWWLTYDRSSNLSLLCRASDMGNAFACSTLSLEVWNKNNDEAFHLANFAAAQNERDGFWLLGSCFRDGIFCDDNSSLAKEKFLIAAEFGHIWAAHDYCELIDGRDIACWIWFSRAAVHGLPYSFLISFSNQIKRFFSGSGSASIVFLIGHSLKGNIDMEKKAIFGVDYEFDAQIRPVNQAVSFYHN